MCSLSHVHFTIFVPSPPLQGYMLRAQERREFFDDDNVVIIFSNAMDLLKFQREFLKELKSAFSAVDPGNSMIGKVFANNVSP